MLKELWEKMHRPDAEWIETEAIVRNVLRYEGVDLGEPVQLAEITFRYIDNNQETQYGSAIVDSGYSLYHLKENDTFSVRYDAARPYECEPRELRES
jgi:hypothetical protein